MMESPSKLIELDWQPSARHLRQFALCLAALLLVAAWLASGWWRWVGLAMAASVVVTSWSWPTGLKPIYIIVTLITFPLGLVVGEIALLVIYLGVFLPLGLIFRCMRRDALERTIDRNAVTYWKDKDSQPDKRSFLRRY